MDEILDFYKKELERESASLAEATRRRLEASDEESDHSKNVNALKQLIAYREKFLASNAGASLEFNRKIEEIAATATAKQIESPGEPIGRTEFVVRMVRDSGFRGVTPKEIKQAALYQGMKDLPKNFPYTTVWKLKEAGKIEERDGRYVLKEEKDEW